MDQGMENYLPVPLEREQLSFLPGYCTHFGQLAGPRKLLIFMNYTRHNDEELSDSSSENEFSNKITNVGEGNMYEDVSDSEIDEKEHANRMNDVGVVDITYAQRTVWLVKVRTLFLKLLLLTFI